MTNNLPPRNHNNPPDLIEQEVVAALTALSAPVQEPPNPGVTAGATGAEGLDELVTEWDSGWRQCGCDRCFGRHEERDAVLDDVAETLVPAIVASLRTAPPVGARVTDAARDVLAERARQTEVEGWSAEHDDCHDRSELAQAAACYALSGTPVDEGLFIHGRWKDKIDLFWPFCRSWFRPTNRRRDLVKAGALILAEIERLDRAAALLPAGEGE